MKIPLKDFKELKFSEILLIIVMGVIYGVLWFLAKMLGITLLSVLITI